MGAQVYLKFTIKIIHPIIPYAHRLLVNVTTPLEKLVDAERCGQSKNGRNLLKRLSKTSLEIKRTFLDYRTTQAVVKAIKVKAKKVSWSKADGVITIMQIVGPLRSLLLV